MNIKHLLGTAVLGALIPMGAMAGSDDKSEKVVEALNLDGDRADQVEEVMSNYYDQKKTVMEQTKDQVKTLKEQKEERLKDILSDDEFEQYESIADAHKNKHHKKWKKD